MGLVASDRSVIVAMVAMHTLILIVYELFSSIDNVVFSFSEDLLFLSVLLCSTNRSEAVVV